MRTNRSVVCSSFFALTAFALGACGGSSTNSNAPTDSGTNADAVIATDAGTDVVVDAASEAASEAAPYPAFKIDAPQITSAGGVVLKSPVLIPVTWASDPDAPKYNDFVQKIGGSSYWSTAVGEYGVGPATAGAPVSLPTTATVYSQDDIDAFISAQLSDLATSKWPAPTANSVYVLFFPPNVELTIPSGGGAPTDAGVAEAGTTEAGVGDASVGDASVGDAGAIDAGPLDAGDPSTDPNNACVQGVGGYHTATVLADNTTIVSYAIVPHCAFGDAVLNDFQYITAAASHEIAEASTDPIPSDPTAMTIATVGDKAGYDNFDTLHYAWSTWQSRNVENGDDCEFYGDSFVADGGFGYAVQRLWSNASIAAGHSPCVPIFDTSEPYFNVMPLALGTTSVSIRAPGGTTSTPTNVEGIDVKVGATASFDVGFYSDGPMAPWGLTVLEGGIEQVLQILDPQPGDPAITYYTTLTVDAASGQNGDKTTVHVKVNSAPPRNRVLITLVSLDPTGKHHHYWPVLVTTN